MQFLDRTGVGTLWSMCKTKFALKDHSHNYLPLSGGTLTGDLLFSNSGTTFRQIRGTCGDNDFWRIGGGATGNNAGYMEIATADDGNEPIYVRQYTGVFSSVNRTLTLLDANGYTHFPSYISIGGNENNNSSPDRVWGSNGSDSYLRSYRTSALNVAYASSAGNADTVDGEHLIKNGSGTGIKQVYYFNMQGTNASYIKLGTLSTVLGTGSGSSKVMFTVKGGIDFGGTNESVYEVAASTRGSIQVTSTLVRGNRELKFGYVSTSSNVEIWMAYDRNYRGVTEVEVSSSVNFTLAMTETTTKPSGFVEGSYRILASTEDNVASATKLQTPRNIWGQSFDGTRDIPISVAAKMPLVFFKRYDNDESAGYVGCGSSSNNNIYIESYTNSNIILGLSNSNIGVGTSSPSYKLHVAGDIYTTTGFKKNGSSDSYVLLGGGGHKLESSLNVASASVASNASTVNGHTVNANVPSNAKFTDTNTWRPIQDNLTSTSTSESLSANLGRVLKGLVDGKANSSHTHNYAGSGSPGGSANSAIGVVDYGQTNKTIQIGYSGDGITGDQIRFIAGYTDGDGNVNAKIKDVSKYALRSWLGLGSLAYSSSSIPTNLSLLNNDKGFVTGSVSGNTVTINGSSTTWTNTWRGIQDNLTSSSTSDSLSANQGRILKSLVDSKANSNEVIKSVSVLLYGDTINGLTPTIVVTDNANQKLSFTINKANGNTNGLMSFKDKNKLDSIPYNLSDLCRFNFVNSISECKSDRINFFLRCPDYIIRLDPFDSYPDGTILLITINDNAADIEHRSGRWYSDGNNVSENYSCNAYKEEINLITKNNGMVHHYRF